MKREKKVSDAYVSGFRTICEVHREIYDIIIEKDYVDETLIKLLQEAFTMAKKMNHKLRQYKYNYDDGWWEEIKKEVIEEKLKRRKGR